MNRINRDYDTFSAALGLIYEGDDALRTGLNFSRVERAPSAEELFSNGPHIATQAFEIGDPDLAVESAWGIEAFARGRIGTAQFNVAVFKQWFNDYIFLTDIGEEEDGLPVFVYLQQDAQYTGAEAEITFPIYDTGSFGLNADLRASYVEAEFADDTSVPRIPPLQLFAALEAQTEAVDLRGEVQWFAKQDQIARFETPTDDFALVNLIASWRPFSNNENVTLQVAGENLFDVTGRRHASFTKDFVPLAGRNVRASVRVSF